MFHPLGVWWDVFEYVIPELEKIFHLIIPAVPGMDPDVPLRDFSSIEDIAEEIEEWLIANGHAHVKGLYGCSMGGALVIRMLADGAVKADNAVIDGGITPYQLPNYVYHNIVGANKQQLLRETLRVLKKGGTCSMLSRRQ